MSTKYKVLELPVIPFHHDRSGLHTCAHVLQSSDDARLLFQAQVHINSETRGGGCSCNLRTGIPTELISVAVIFPVPGRKIARYPYRVAFEHCICDSPECPSLHHPAIMSLQYSL